MTEHDSNIRTSFRNLDGPVAVDPAFAERVRAEMTEISQRGRVQDASSVAAGPVVSLIPEVARRRNRLLDVAAAALLILALGGLLTGAIRILRSDERGTTILVVAPTSYGEPSSPANRYLFDLQAPYMATGSAANDGTVSGIAPVSGEYQKLWESQTVTFYSAIFGDHVYYQTESIDDSPFTVQVCRDASTGDILWQVPSVSNVSMSVVSAGVIIGVPGREADTFYIALLDHWTGAILWQTENVYQIPLPTGDVGVVISDTSILFTSEAMAVRLDLRTGTELWTHTLSDSSNWNFNEEIGLSRIVTDGETAYVSDPGLLTITALAMDTGEMKWSIPQPESGPIGEHDWIQISMVAVDRGMVLSWGQQGENLPGTIELRSADDGQVIWQRDDLPYSWSFTRSGNLLITSLNPETLSVVTLDIDTGETANTFPVDNPNEWNLTVSVPSENVLVQGFHMGFEKPTWAEANIPFYTSFFGRPEIEARMTVLNPDSFSVERTLIIRNCWATPPIAANGDLLCHEDSKIALYRPVNPPDIATPDASVGGE